MVKGKIALLLGQADEVYQQEFVSGVMREAFSHGYTVCVFSMYIKYQDTREREIGDSNIFRLFNPALFDGVILLSDTIQTPGVEETIEKWLKESFSGPVLCIDKESRYYPSVWLDGYDAIYAMVSHLIEVHKKKDIAFLAGRANHKHSIRRVEAYRKAMEDHGLKVSESRIHYGDFWYTSGSGWAEEMLRNREDLPEALVSANDPMAIGAATVFEEEGVRIPEDIAITGYGTSEEGQNSPKSLTSCYIPAEEYGALAVQNVLRLKEGEEVIPPKPGVKLYLGESCGCEGIELPVQSRRRTTWATRLSEDGYFSLHNTMPEDLIRSQDLEEFLENVYENLYHIKEIERFDLCLNQLWLTPEEMQLRDFPREGYSERIVHAISYNSVSPGEGKLGIKSTFMRKDLLPKMDMVVPKGYIFTPIFTEDVSLGYAVVSYGEEPRSYSETYRLWVKELSRGLEALRRREIMQALEIRLAGLEGQKYPAGVTLPTGEDKLSPEEIEERREVERLLDENLFTYHFQPIISAKDGSIYSYEALMRSGTERRIPPLTILRHADQMKRLDDIERATMLNVLGILDKHPESFSGRKLFINSIPGSQVEQEESNRIRELIHKYPETVVIELTEQAELQDEALERLKNEFRTVGAGFALDDYGTGYSNISNLLRYMPDVVKIDRSLLSEIQNSSQKQHFVRDIIEFCHANEILALAEGVETSEELRTVILLGADLIQGYYTARPAAEILPELETNLREEIVRYYQERLDGSGDEEYIAGRVNRVSMSQLLRDHKTTLVIGDKDATFRDITIVGTPGKAQRLQIEILEDYDGRVTLENVTLSSFKKRPCIHMAENSRMTLRLVGANQLIDAGIQVPESAELSIEGEGSLYIRVDGLGGYGIGNQWDATHGKISFYQDGEIRMNLNGNRVVGIGSGRGGDVQINRGKYDIYINGDECVGIGAIEGDASMVIQTSDVEVDVAALQGVCIGSFQGNADLEMWSSLVKANIEGKRVAAVGSLKGEFARIDAEEMGLLISISADQAAGVGSLFGKSDVEVGSSTFRCEASGMEVYAYGGLEPDTTVSFTNSDINIDLKTENGGISKAPEDKIEYNFGRVRLKLNETVLR